MENSSPGHALCQVDGTCVYGGAAGLVVADVVCGPPFPERLAARRKLADEVDQTPPEFESFFARLRRLK